MNRRPGTGEPPDDKLLSADGAIDSGHEEPKVRMSIPVSHRALHLIGLIALLSLVIAAVDAGIDDPAASPWLVAADLAVGLAFLLGAALAPGPGEMRILVAAIGVSWLLGSWLPNTTLLHLLVLAAALIVFPRGRPSNAIHWALMLLVFPVALGVIPQLGVAIMFAAIAGFLLMTVAGGGARYPATAAAALALVLGGSWAYSRIDPVGFDPVLALLLYETVLVAVAVAFPFAVRSRMAEGAKLTDLVLSDEGRAGLDGLASVLAETLQDPGLRIDRMPDAPRGQPKGSLWKENDPATRRVQVSADRGGPIASVSYKSLALDEPSIREAVLTAVRLAAQNQILQESLQAKLADLEEARARLLAAVDKQRQATASRLRVDVGTSLRGAMGELATIVGGLEQSEATAALAVVADELARAETEVESLVAGVLLEGLGDRHLADFISDLAERSSVPVTIKVSSEIAADAVTEATLFFVCSEALTNAVKHARASKIDVTLASDGRSVVLLVSDDGRGGADPSGSGLQGLADRIAARGGRLRVDSSPGAGTALTATLPL